LPHYLHKIEIITQIQTASSSNLKRTFQTQNNVLYRQEIISLKHLHLQPLCEAHYNILHVTKNIFENSKIHETEIQYNLKSRIY